MDSDPQPNLWRSAEWWIAQIVTVFGEPAHIALGLAPRVHVLLRRWLAGVEEFVRRLIIAEALALPAPQPGPKLKIDSRKKPPSRISFTFWRRPRLGRKRKTPRTLSTRPRSTRWDPWRPETPDTRPDLPRGYRPEPGGWHEPPPPTPRPRATPEQRRPFGHAPTWPMPSVERSPPSRLPAAGLSRRVEALIRVIAKPAACARRLAARLARSAGLRLHLIHPPPDPGPLTPARDDIAAAQKEIERKLRPPDSS